MFPFLRSLRVLGVFSVFAASSASAGLTPVSPTPHATEASAAQILSHRYGGTFSESGSGFTNGVVTATRIDDLNDVAWMGDRMTLNAIASFSRSEQSVGLLLGKSGGGYEHLFTVNEFGYLPNSPLTIDTSGQHFRFVLDNAGTSLRSSSLAAENSSGDQLVTYRIDGIDKGTSRYVLFWEDVPVGQGDQDYNDLVVEAAFAGNGGPTAVPLPPAVFGGAALMGAIALKKYLNKRRAAVAA